MSNPATIYKRRANALDSFIEELRNWTNDGLFGTITFKMQSGVVQPQIDVHINKILYKEKKGK